MLSVSEQTIRRTRLRYEAEGLQVALEDKPHPKREPKLNEQQEAQLVVYYLQYAASRSSSLDTGIDARTSDPRWHCVWRCARDCALTAQKNKLKPWLVKSWCIPEVTSEFLRKTDISPPFMQTSTSAGIAAPPLSASPGCLHSPLNQRLFAPVSTRGDSRARSGSTGS